MSSYLISDASNDWSLSDRVDSEGRQLLKIPIAFTGEWDHPDYGKVKFTKEDLATLTRNWSDARAGYEPPLFKGHPMHKDVLEGEASEGWPELVYTEGNVLYGEYSPTDSKLIEEVRSKRFRYASAEIIPNAVDKTTGEEMGPLLVGVALTNRPFLPMKDKCVEVITKFSDSSVQQTPYIFSFDLQPNYQEPTMANTTTSVIEEPTVVENQVAPTPAPTSVVDTDTVPRQQYESLQQKFSEVAEQFSGMAAEHSALKQQLSELVSREKQKDIDEKLNKLNKLDLPAERKELFSEWIREGVLSEAAEQKLFADCQAEAQKFGHIFRQAQGVSDENVSAQAQTLAMPQVFSDVIARNQEIIAARRKQSY